MIFRSVRASLDNDFDKFLDFRENIGGMLQLLSWQEYLGTMLNK